MVEKKSNAKKPVQKKGWRITFFDTLSGKKLKTEVFDSIKSLSKKHKQLNEETWRNVSLGRSRVYDPFFKLEHIKL